MTELYINQGVISKDVVKCVIRVDCSGTSTKLANVSKVQFYKIPIVAPIVAPNVVPKAPNVVPIVPKAPNVVPIVPKAPNVVPIVPKASNVVPIVPKAPNVSTKGNSCPVCPTAQSCPAVPNCPQASKEEKTMLQQLLDEVEKERASSSMFGGKRKSKNVKFYF
jgi:hypothetical protein